MRLDELVAQGSARLEAAAVAFGHGTHNAHDEAAWLTLWRLGLPLDTDLTTAPTIGADGVAAVQALIDERIARRLPAAYLTGEAWLQGVPFFADARAIVPRSLIAEPLAEMLFDAYLPDGQAGDARVLDLCTGNGSLAVLAALAWPHARVDAIELSATALALARRNVERHGVAERVRLIEGDGIERMDGRYDLILCNPPYVNAASMAALPAEFRAEPELALAGGADGMDFVRRLIASAPRHLRPEGALVLEIGHERAHFESAFPHLNPLWLETSAGQESVLLLHTSDFPSP